MPTPWAQTREMLTALSDVLDVSAPERRRAVRVPFEAPLAVEPCAGDGVLGEPVTLHLRDFSAVGIGGISATAMPKAATFVLRLRCKSQRVGVVCSVAHCRPNADGRFRIGAQFERILGGSQTGIAGRIEWVEPAAFIPLAAAA